MATPSTLTNLLNTLHSHLQSQTQLLPTLHAQLGLPSTALEDELKALQLSLMKNVEAQIEGRKQEVQAWMDKCEAVEEECLRYSNALGGNIKATGTSDVEIRKEQVLPTRFEMVSEYQEKLRQLYHTKLEQLTSLTAKLNHMARTLGTDYFPADVLEPSPVKGDEQGDHRDVTPERFSKLEKELVRGKGEVTKRLQQLAVTLSQIDWLYAELGKEPPAFDDIPSSSLQIPTSISSDPFRASTPLSAVSRPSPTPQYPRDESEDTYIRIFARFVARNAEAASESLPPSSTNIPIGLESVDPTLGLIAWSSQVCGSLEDTKKRRETHIQAMYDQLEALWRRLGVEERDMDAFVEMNRGSTEEVVRAYEEELERMMELKRERMGVFVSNARDEILRLWDDLMTGDEERGAFAPFADDEHTEELLTIHEDEIKRLKEERRAKAPLLASIKKYFDICGEEQELAAAANDQSRLTGRGARDPGRLLREEKMRKRVQKEKPRLEQDLIATIPAWEADAGRPFLVHGESILQHLYQAVGAVDQENTANGKRNKPNSRGNSVPPRATTPSNSSAYVPTKGVVTPSVRPSSSNSTSNSNSAPAKRQKLTSEGSFAPRAPLGSTTRANVHTTTNTQSRIRERSRDPSPSKIPGHPAHSNKPTSSSSSSSSSLPRPVPLVVPKAGTQHFALGHGRVPSSGVLTSGYRLGSSTSTARQASAGAHRQAPPRAKRESFRPRPSIDHLDPLCTSSLGTSVFGGVGGRVGGGGALTASVQEEMEECC